MIPFTNRWEAGEMLADYLTEYAGRDDVVVLALTNGGAPVAAEVANLLGATMDVLTVRKLGAPWNPELAFGAIATGGIYTVDEGMVRNLALSEHDVESAIVRELAELKAVEQRYRGLFPLPNLTGKIVILVTDGLSTGSTMRMAVDVLRQLKPSKIVAATPVISREASAVMSASADDCAWVINPTPFYGVDVWYTDFGQVSDEKVKTLLELQAARIQFRKASNF